jgi:hypothetical protein
MLGQFHDYFTSIQMPKPIIEKANQLCKVYAEFIAEPILNVVVCDLFETEGARRFTSLWLRTPNLFVEAKNFVSDYQMDFTNTDQVEWLEFVRSDLTDYSGETSPQTTLAVTVAFKQPLHGRLHAAHNNCLHLYKFAVENFKLRTR